MKWLARSAALLVVSLVILFAVAAFAGTNGKGAPLHNRMDPVSHADYEIHKMIAHTP